MAEVGGPTWLRSSKRRSEVDDLMAGGGNAKPLEPPPAGAKPMSSAREAAQQDRSKQALRALRAGEAPTKLPQRKSMYVSMLFVVCALELWGLSRYFPLEEWLNAHPFYTDSYA